MSDLRDFFEQYGDIVSEQVIEMIEKHIETYRTTLDRSNVTPYEQGYLKACADLAMKFRR